MKPRFAELFVSVLIMVGAVGTLLGETLTVTNTADSGSGSLRQAILTSNATVGVRDTIAFNIPGTGFRTISPDSPFPTITDPVLIDGYTQPGAIENSATDAFDGTLLIELDGENGGANVDGLTITAGGSTVRGLVVNRFAGNGIRLESTDNHLEGNLIGTDATGTASSGNGKNGVEIFESAENFVGGTTAAARNVISGNGSNGVMIDGEGGANLVQGNFIGTDVTGKIALGNSGTGVVVQNAGTNTIGGSTSTAGNVISGNGDDGIFISGALSGLTTVIGNFIGTQSNGVDPLGNTNDGLELSGSDPVSYVFIVGAPPNVIAFNGARGILVSGGTGHLISGNSIFSNGGLGIDLGEPGVLPNDDGDEDSGPNDLQNFPVLTSASRSGGKTRVQGTLNSTSNSSFGLNFYVSAAADPTGYGEGQTYLGLHDVTTDDSGMVTFTAELDMLAPPGQTLVTATVIDGNHGTSEFSAPVELVNMASHLLNVSARLEVETGDNVLIAGFILTGGESDLKRVLVRAIGPSLAGAGLNGVLVDPVLELHEPDGTVVTNDNWREMQEQEISATTIPPQDDLESAIVADLEPGAYTVVMRGKDGGTGIGLVEAYALDGATPSQLANISTRGLVQTNDGVMIGGFISGGGGNGPSSFLIRALGPSLENAGVTNALQDPTLELYDANGTFIIANDDWRFVQQYLIEQTGIPPTDERESAVVWTLEPGSYTAIVRGKENTNGVGLVEVYNLQ
ncbi:MAG: right-handed parallel beta-helix repeat-containing protein [Verrucomicrobiota bacterium]|nr:right-handed parallel beta-helix repeat-containing protein [Verrucomicrobiota bacterium]